MPPSDTERVPVTSVPRSIDVPRVVSREVPFSWRPVPVMSERVSEPRRRMEETAREVEVEFVVVEVRAVKFCNVVEPRARMFARVARPDEVRFPVLREVEKRFVLDAVVEKRFVVVAFVDVEFNAVKFWRVVEERERSPF